MTIQDAIKHIDEDILVKENRDDNYYHHLQLRDWLEELNSGKTSIDWYEDLKKEINSLENTLCTNFSGCDACKKDHYQILEWLKVLEEVRNAKV